MREPLNRFPPDPSRTLTHSRADPQLYRSYLEDFHEFVLSIGGPTAEVMSPILNFEADRRSLNITINSFGTSLSKEQRGKLLPKLGRLYPEGTMALSRADDVDQVKAVIDPILEYRPFLEGQGASGGAGPDGGIGGGGAGGAGGAAASLEDHFFQHEVHLNKLAFMQQFQIGVFYAFFKLKEQEIRSLTWIAECIAQNAKDRIKCVFPSVFSWAAPLTRLFSTLKRLCPHVLSAPDPAVAAVEIVVPLLLSSSPLQSSRSYPCALVRTSLARVSLVSFRRILGRGAPLARLRLRAAQLRLGRHVRPFVLDQARLFEIGEPKRLRASSTPTSALLHTRSSPGSRTRGAGGGGREDAPIRAPHSPASPRAG